MLLTKQKQKIHDWFEDHAARPSAKWWLAAISFIESSFFPIPPDPFLMLALLAKRNSWWQLSLIVTLFSVAGAVFGYVVGFLFFESIGKQIVDFYHLEKEFLHISELFKENTFWTIFTAGFTPLPYKLFTITAGFAQINIFSFIIASLIGRGARFFFVGLIMKTFGKQIGSVFFKYFNMLLSLLVLLIIIYIALKFFF